MATLREPLREKADGPAEGPASASSVAAVVRLLRERRVLRLLLVAGAFSIGAQAACSIFMAPLLIRVHGLDVGRAGALLALSYGLGGMVGMPVGGMVTDAIRKRRPGRELEFFGLANGVVALLAAAAFVAPDWRVAIALIGVYAVGAVLYYSVTFSAFLTECPPHLRGGGSSTMLLAMNLFGYGLAPQFAGVVSDAAKAMGMANPLQFALVCSAMLFAVGGVFLILAGRALRRNAEAEPEPRTAAAALAGVSPGADPPG
jgi:fucose permease